MSEPENQTRSRIEMLPWHSAARERLETAIEGGRLPHALLLQAEYRWEIFTAVDGAIFYDTGKVASRLEDLNLRDLESDYGFGFRFGSANGVFLRIEAAFGSSDGNHFIFRFNNVF